MGLKLYFDLVLRCLERVNGDNVCQLVVHVHHPDCWLETAVLNLLIVGQVAHEHLHFTRAKSDALERFTLASAAVSNESISQVNNRLLWPLKSLCNALACHFQILESLLVLLFL